MVVLAGSRTHTRGDAPQARKAWAATVGIVDHYLSMYPDDAVALLTDIAACRRR